MKDVWIKICALALIIAVAGVPAAVMGTEWLVPFGINDSLECVLENNTFASGDTITLIDDINTSLVTGNTTDTMGFDIIYINVNTTSGPYTIYMNGSLFINGTGQKIYFSNGVGSTTGVAVTFDLTRATTGDLTDFKNNASAIDIVSHNVNIVTTELSITGTAKSAHLTLLNVTGDGLRWDNHRSFTWRRYQLRGHSWWSCYESAKCVQCERRR